MLFARIRQSFSGFSPHIGIQCWHIARRLSPARGHADDGFISGVGSAR